MIIVSYNYIRHHLLLSLWKHRAPTHAVTSWTTQAFSRHSGTCRLLGDRKHPPAPHALRVGDFLRVGSVGVVVVEAHDGRECRVLSEEKIRKIVRDTTSGAAG